MKPITSIFFVLSAFIYTIQAQNLPSLLLDKNINSTFSITAYDEKTQEWGIAVATHNICVGNSTVYIEPGLGAFSVIAETYPAYAINGFQQLQAGQSIKEAILFTKEKDPQAHYRQVAGIDKDGNVFAFTGEALQYWVGKSTHRLGDKYVVMGNQLDETVLEAMAQTYEQATGTLAERLLQSLIAGQEAGGQISGKQSAALIVKGSDNAWYNQIDLRVDNSKQPFKDLQKLLDHHFGRIKVNQSRYALESGNMERAKNLLQKAEILLDGWNGMYDRIAAMHAAMGNDDVAADWVLKALDENPNWKVKLPAFYFLREHKKLKDLINPDNFSTKDWENAVHMFPKVERNPEAIKLAQKLLKETAYQSSYMYYLLGRSYSFAKENEKAVLALQKAIAIDPKNVEAQLLLKKLR
ncbi:MAG: DUF1028 domain-containing protein [Bacteroidota bacterium]